MVGISRDQKYWTHNQTKIIDVVEKHSKKRSWTGHKSNKSDHRWTAHVKDDMVIIHPDTLAPFSTDYMSLMDRREKSPVTDIALNWIKAHLASNSNFETDSIIFFR